MYVIFPLDDLLDLNSARKSKRETAPSSTLNHKRHTVEGLPPSQPNHQLQPPLFNQQSTPNTPNPKPPQQQQQQQQPKPQKLTSPQKTPSIASNSQANTPISSGQTASSVPSGSSNSSSHTTSAVKHHPQLPPAVQRTQQQPEQLTQRQQSSYSTSTESSSLSSSGAKAKVLLSPQSAGGGKAVTNRYSWGGSPTATLQEPSVSRSSSFKQPAKPPLPPHPSASDNKDNNSTLIADDNKVIKLNNLNISNSVRGSGGNVQIVSGESVIKSPPGPQSQNVRPKLVKSESFRSHLSAGGAGAFRPPHHQQQQQYQQQQQHQQQQLQQQQQQQQQHQQQQQLLESEGHRQLVQQHELSLQVTNPSQGSPSQPRQPSGGRSTHSSGSPKTSDISFPSGSAARPKNTGESIKPQGVAGAPPRGVHKGAMASEVNLRDLTHPGVNEALKAHNSVTFKLVKTVSDFTGQLSRLHEQHAEEIQRLVENFRKKNSELRNERPPCSSHVFQAWETLLQEVEVDSQIHTDVAATLNRQVSRPLIEKTFYRKIQSRKVFTHRESFDTILAKTEDMLKKCRRDYTDAYQSHCRTQSNASLAAYFDAHNAYVQQLHATNGMLQEYNNTTLPTLLEELEAVYMDVCGVVADCVLQGADIVAAKALEQHKRYESLCVSCRTCDARTDLALLSRALDVPMAQGGRLMQHRYNPPQPPPPQEASNGDILPQEGPPPANLKNELVLDRLAALSSRNRYDALRKESTDLERQIAQLQEAQDTLLRIQQRSIESSLFNKANELQEDISMKRFDLQVAQVHLSAVRAQKELFASKDGGGAEGRERKMSNSSGGSMKTKWMKAFKSLKSDPAATNLPPSGSPGKRYTFSNTVLSVMASRKNGRDKEAGAVVFESAQHIFQEYTYKKITACDVCHQILRGHSRQGLKCRMCKMNVHVECQEQVGKCQPKSRLLRRQRSTSEIESKQMEPGEEDPEPSINFNSLIASQPARRVAEAAPPTTPAEIQLEKGEEVDLIYQVLKQAGDLGGRRSAHGSVEREIGREVGGSGASSGSGSATSLHRRHPRPSNTGSTLTVNPAPVASCSEPKLSVFALGMIASTKSRTTHHNHHRSKSPLYNHLKSHTAPSSPVHNRRLLSARHMRMSSVELPDDNEKSLSSASTSPCPSPIPQHGPPHTLPIPTTSPSHTNKPHRLLPANLYVVLYNFTSRHPDELDLRAGYKVTVTDTSDPDWWQGKCLGRTGYFPSKYVTRLNCGEKPLQVTHNLQVTDGDNGIKLLRDQIVIQMGEELDGMVMIRNGDNQQGVCPLKYLQEA